ncbi:lamin tail domain-containing protein [Cryptosporangium arvum]|uniref:Putative extracellular nuclease n=1 Tax=Cryptosporangium arvum DSM 44712 TaxID=927661 RepID=A0A010Z0F5_9ACTN|nr:lamin tail domain-containing protein [Cryptosporangium arvum]EXG80933.1 putative extracellular nuclease [Cryptosporangium arvum DSM 44712]
MTRRPQRHARRNEFTKLSFYLPTAFPVLLLAIALGATATSSTVGTASRPADLVISQIYGGGGESGSIWTADFIELTNRGDEPVNLRGWSVQYAPPRERGWGVTELSGSIPAGGRYLIAQAGGPNGTTHLPKADVTGSLDLGSTSGKVALVHAVETLHCVASCTTVEGVRDFVGYGNADDAEGRPAPALSNTTSIVRRDISVPADQGTSSIEDDPGGPAGVENAKQQERGVPGVDGSGGVDSGSNSADFVVATPAPPGGAGDKAGRTARIADIQGRSHTSPLAGRLVTSVPGVVTAVGRTGFWMQDPEPDDDPATSDGLFVYTGNAPRVQSGDTVRVAGTVTEYRPGAAAGADNLTTTELIRPTVSVVSSAARRPVPVLIGPGGRMPPTQIRTDAPGDVESTRLFAPTLNALDFYESLEGMLVRLNNPTVVGPTSVDGQLPVLPAGAGSSRTTHGGLRLTDTDPNTERIVLDDLLAPLPVANVGDQLPGALDGVLDYGAGDYRVELLSTPVVRAGKAKPETARAPKPDELTVSSIDISGADPNGGRGRLKQLAATVVRGLRAPDVLVVEEMPDDDGATYDAEVGADEGWAALLDAIRAAGGPRYEVRQIDPVSRRDGSGAENRRIGFLFNPARVSFVDRGAGDATTATEVDTRDGEVGLTLSPGRVAPAATAFRDARKSLAGEFRFRGRTVFVIGNDFASGRGDGPLYGRQQPRRHTSEQQRGSQASAVRTFVDELLDADRDAAVVVVGGIADTDGSPTLGLLTDGGTLADVATKLPAADRYSVVSEGNAFLLDHVLVTPALSGAEVDVVHAQSDFASRWTDRDPLVGYLRMPKGPEDSPEDSSPATP